MVLVWVVHEQVVTCVVIIIIKGEVHSKMLSVWPSHAQPRNVCPAKIHPVYVVPVFGNESDCSVHMFQDEVGTR